MVKGASDLITFAHALMMTRRRKSAFGFCAAACVPVWLSCCLAMTGAEIPSQSSQLLEQSWVAGSDNRWQRICAMLQTRQGYLWIGTNKGLVRFDGVRFTDFLYGKTPGMSQGETAFAGMWEDSRGGVWAGTLAGVTHYDGGRFSALTTRDGLPNDPVVRVDGDETGAVWIFTRKGGVCRWKDGALQTVHPERDNGSAEPLITDFATDPEDMSHMGLWRRRGASGLDRFAYGHWREFPLPNQGRRREYPLVRSIYEDSLHRVWYSLHDEPGTSYEVTSDNHLVKYSGLPAESFTFFRDRDGFLWISDHQSRTARWKDGKLFPVPSLQTPNLAHIIQRADGGLWAGTFSTKLFLFKPRLITPIETPGVPEVGPVVFRQRDGTVWAAGTALVRLEGNKVITVASLSDSKEWGIATALGEDGYGNLLLGDRFRAGVRTLEGRRIVASPLYGAVLGIVQAILLDSAGDEWFGTTTGLFHAHAGKVQCVRDNLPGTKVRCLLETAPGDLWIGTDKGPALLSGGLVKPFPSNAVWKFGAVSSLAGDQQGNVWISTLNSGIVQYANGTFRKFDQSDGLPTDMIFSLDAFDSSYLWLRTDAGLLRISKESLLRGPTEPKRELRIAQFDEGDGLPSKQMSPQGNQGVFHLPDGTAWFSSLGGIASVPSAMLDRAVSRPRAVIEEHVTDASSPGFSEPSGIVMKPNETSLEIRYTALGSFRPEQVKFRYRLAGLDETWVPVQNRRAAFYTHLPPGDYVFRVQAADGDEGEWNQPEARIGVTVLTPFYRSWWMKSLVLLALLTAAAAAIEMRRRRMLEAQRVHRAFTHRLLSSQESERKRIAHELHDGLGQHLALIRTLALLPAKLRTSNGTADSDSLASIADQAAVAIHEVEAICYGLRPYQLDRLGLTKAVRSLLRKLEEGNTLVLRGSVDEIDGFFPREQEITFYRILQEGISNILKHAEATEAEIVVACNGSKLQLRIEDNGRGFSMTAGETAGESLGLPGIAERAEALGGRATIESGEQAGTRILVEVTRARRVRDTEEL